MNKVLIVDASDSDRRLMSSLLTRAGYEPIAVESMEAAKEEVAKLPPGSCRSRGDEIHRRHGTGVNQLAKA